MNATDTAARNLDAIRTYLALVERLEDAEAVARLWHPDGVFEELPNAIAKQGSKRDRTALGSSYAHAKALLASQRYEITNAFASGDQVLVEFVWTGTIKIDVGPLHAGETLRAHCAGVFEMRDGLIYRQRQYDCYDPR